jgi:hypothetical protein
MTTPKLALNLVPVTRPSAAEPAAPAIAPVDVPNAATVSAEIAVPTPAPATPAAADPKPRKATARPAAAADPRREPAGAWREWGSFDRTVSYRLPAELTAELDERMWKLRIREVGVTVAAALTQLLDLDDEALLDLVERASDAKPSRRATGRR